MNWKDTVMDSFAIEDFFVKPIDYDSPVVEEELSLAKDVAEAQAEISFKAGQESRCDWHKPLPIIISESFTEGKKAGIREVVDDLDKTHQTSRTSVEFENGAINMLREWQAKLKEWEVKDGQYPHKSS